MRLTLCRTSCISLARPLRGEGRFNLQPELVQRTLHLHTYSLRKNNITVDYLPERFIGRWLRAIPTS